MKRFRCRACGGQFMDPQPDGTSYFHACAPLSRPELVAAGGNPDDAARRPQARPGHRDERAAHVGLFDVEGRTIPEPHAPRSEGRGREELEG